MSSLCALAQIIFTGVCNIESACATRGKPYPSLDDPYTLENSTYQKEYVSDAAPIIAAAYQLIATLSHPMPYLFNTANTALVAASIAAVTEGCVPDILREAGPQGLHVRDVAVQNNLDHEKLERILRFLSSRHMFQEISPAVFANNRISDALCTGNPVAATMDSPLSKWDGSNGIAAIIEFAGSDTLKMVAYLAENLADPETAHSNEPNKAPVNRAFKTDLPFYSWIQLPQNIKSLKRLQVGMQAFTGYAQEHLPSGGFEWDNLPVGSLIVDVGGGIGTVTMALMQRYSHLHYIVQDLPSVIQEGKVVWSSLMSDKLETGVVTLQEHDFFSEQPVKDASVFVLRYILHNWPGHYCLKLLKRLREAAQPHTKLVVFDEITEYLCRGESMAHANIPGGLRQMAPEPLLPHPEVTTGMAYTMDILMMACLNSQERTLSQLVELFQSAGWKLERVCRIVAPHPQQLICSPL